MVDSVAMATRDRTLDRYGGFRLKPSGSAETDEYATAAIFPGTRLIDQRSVSSEWPTRACKAAFSASSSARRWRSGSTATAISASV